MAIRTTDDLLNKIKRRAFIPTSQATFTDDELLEIATEELHGVIVPNIMKTREDYFVYKDTSSQLTGQKNPIFNIPARAVGLQLREVSITVGNTEQNVPRLDIEDRAYQDAGGYIYGFDITNNQVNLRGSNTGTLNMYYYLRPGDLVKSTNARSIVSVDAPNKQITVATIPSGWTTNTKFDVIKSTAGFDTKSISMTINAIDAGSGLITFDNDFPTESWRVLEAGDWLIEAEKSPVPQIPLEWQEYLAEAVVCYIMESMGDSEGFERSRVRKEELKTNATSVISGRVDGQSKKLVPRRNRGSSIYDSKYRNY